MYILLLLRLALFLPSSLRRLLPLLLFPLEDDHANERDRAHDDPRDLDAEVLREAVLGAERDRLAVLRVARVVVQQSQGTDCASSLKRRNETHLDSLVDGQDEAVRVEVRLVGDVCA